jgi:hypothetical protein
LCCVLCFVVFCCVVFCFVALCCVVLCPIYMLHFPIQRGKEY